MLFSVGVGFWSSAEAEIQNIATTRRIEILIERSWWKGWQT
jgi:hypothetical protein